MAWVVALVPRALDDTARAVVKVTWTSPQVATEVATVVVPVVEIRGGGAAPLIVALASRISAIPFLEY
ncbi:hypothetical protein ACFX10_004794 [Malus domestica]